MQSRSTKAIVVVGSLHYDIMVKAPHRPKDGETVTGSSWFPKFGGKGGNQAVAVAGAGIETRMLGAVGDDNFADFLLDRLTAFGVATNHIARIARVGSGMSVATIDTTGEYGAVIVSGANLHIDPKALSEDSLWSDAAILILQNEVPDAINIEAATQARLRGVTVCLNAAPARPLPQRLSPLIDILIVNALEAEALGSLPVDDLDAALEAAKLLATSFATVIVTAGGDGVAMATRNGVAGTWPAIEVEVQSTHGAGDCFVGTLCAAMASGEPLSVAIDIANQTAAAHVSRRLN